MPGISRQPRGLLSFFGIKNAGRNPGSMGEQLAPVLNLVPWYLAQASESVTANGPVSVIGFNPGFFNVPETETWAILATTINGQAVLGAGQTLQMGAAWERVPTLSIIVPLTTIGNVATVGQGCAAWSPCDTVVFCPPGARLGIFVTQLAAGPITCTMNITRVVMQL